MNSLTINYYIHLNPRENLGYILMSLFTANRGTANDMVSKHVSRVGIVDRNNVNVRTFLYIFQNINVSILN